MTEPLRVMHVVLSMDMGGLERVVDDLVRAADRSEILPSICCVEKPGRLSEGLHLDGVEVVSLNKGSGMRLKGFTRSFRTFRRIRPHVVHTHQVGALFYAGPAARLAGVPVVVHTEHGLRLPESRRLRILGRIGAHYADRIFTVSQDIAREAFAFKVFSPARTRTVINGIDVQRFGKPVDVSKTRHELGLREGDFVVGTVARLSPIKDQKTLIRAFALMRQRVPRAHLVLVGDGPSRTELEALVRSDGLSETVHFAGTQADVVPYLKLFDVFVLSSLSEGIPLVILEAMAAQVPVVSTAVGGIVAIIADGQTGILVPPAQPEALATALVDLAADKTRRNKLAHAGQELARRQYSLERMEKTYLDEYRQLLDRKGCLLTRGQEGTS